MHLFVIINGNIITCIWRDIILLYTANIIIYKKYTMVFRDKILILNSNSITNVARCIINSLRERERENWVQWLIHYML